MYRQPDADRARLRPKQPLFGECWTKARRFWTSAVVRDSRAGPRSCIAANFTLVESRRKRASFLQLRRRNGAQQFYGDKRAEQSLSIRDTI